MTETTATGPRPAPLWSIEQRSIDIGGVSRPMRLVRFAAGWLISVDTESGPTLGANPSPYLAAHLALEPLGVSLVEAMTAVGPCSR